MNKNETISGNRLIDVAVVLAAVAAFVFAVMPDDADKKESSGDKSVENNTARTSAVSGVSDLDSRIKPPPRTGRVKVPVKSANSVPDKTHSDNAAVASFSDPESDKFGTRLPIYKDNMIDMLKDESRDGTTGALSMEEIRALEKSGNVIF